MTPTALHDLLARVEAATGPDRRLDEAIAETLLGVTKWKSKHGYWNVDFPKTYPFEEYGQRLVMVTLDGRSPDHEYDSTTGKKLPPEVPPTGWADDVGVSLPEYSDSIDQALALVDRLLPGWRLELTQSADGSWWDAMIQRCGLSSEQLDYFTTSHGTTLPLAILAALLKAPAAQAATRKETA